MPKGERRESVCVVCGRGIEDGHEAQGDHEEGTGLVGMLVERFLLRE